MIPAVALRRLNLDEACHAYLVQRNHSDVVHAATAARPAPVCGQRGKRWYRVETTIRRLCRRCTQWVDRRTPPTAPTPLELAQVLRTVTTIDQLNRVIADVITHRGGMVRVALDNGPLLALHSHVAAARTRINANDRSRR